MKICLKETVLYVEIQLFFEIDFSNLTLKKSVFLLTIPIILSQIRTPFRKTQISGLQKVTWISSFFLQ